MPAPASRVRHTQPNYSLDVFDEKMQLVSKGTLRGGVDLSPGQTYYVSTTLHDGRSMVSRVTPDESSSEFVLNPMQAEVSSPLTAALAPSLDLTKIIAELAPEAFRGTPLTFFRHPLAYFSAMQIYSYSGNLLRPADTRAPKSTHTARLLAFGERQWHLITGADAGVTYVQLLKGNQPVRNYAVPVAPGEHCQIRLLPSKTSEHALDFVLDDPDDDLLLRYGGRYLFQEAAQVAEYRQYFESLKGNETQHPIGAAVQAYVYLRMGNHEGLGEWTASLYENFAWLPDGIAVHAEHQARLGNHQVALEVLLQLGSRGLPIFSSGLSYALNRLRQYRPFMGEELPGSGIETADALIAQLAAYASRTDFRRPILTFSGNDPLSPDANSLGLFGRFGKSIASDLGWTNFPTRALFRE